MARNIECRCDERFTCGYCLRNMKPYFYTPGGKIVTDTTEKTAGDTAPALETNAPRA